MNFALIAGTKIFEMFIMMFIGMIGFKANVLSKDANKRLTDVLLLIVSPILIFMSYQQDFNKQKLLGLGIAIILAFFSHILGIFISRIFIKEGKSKNFEVERMSVVYSNCAFMGIPLLSGLYGAEGVFYVTAYITAFNILIWSHGIMLMSDRFDKQELLKVLRSPNIIAIFLGIIAFITGFRFPEVISNPLNSIAATITPLAMFIAGSTMMEANLLKALKNKRLHIISILRLFIIPLILIVIFKFLPFDKMILTTILIASACPTASSTTMFALMFDKNAEYAAELFGFTTIVCIITIPLVILIYNF